jgi:hypothetical protein
MKWALKYGSIGVVAGIVMSVFGYMDRAKHAKLKKDGVTVTGIITQGEERSGRRGSKTRSFDVSYTTLDGKQFTEKFKVSKKYFEGHTANGAISVDTAEVRYLPTDPQTAIIVNGTSSVEELLLAGGVVTVVSGVVLALGVIRRGT